MTCIYMLANILGYECFQYAHKLWSKEGRKMEMKKIFFFHYKSFRCKCNDIDVNRGYDISNPTDVTYFVNGPPL